MCLCTLPVQRLYGLVDVSHGWLRAPGSSCQEERFTDLDSAHGAVIFAENMQSLVEPLVALSQESESLGLRVSGINTEIQNFLQAVVGQVSTVTCCDEAVDVTEIFSLSGEPDNSAWLIG